MRLVTFIIFFCLFACNTRTYDCSQSENYLSVFTKGLSNNNIPPPYSNISFFIEFEKNKISETNNIIVYQIYNKFYKDDFNSFEDFLCSLYQNKFHIAENVLQKYRFKYYGLDRKILDYDIEMLKVKFCTSHGNILRLRNDLDNDTRMSVLYNFFKSKYYVAYDDYEGYYHILNDL